MATTQSIYERGIGKWEHLCGLEHEIIKGSSSIFVPDNVPIALLKPGQYLIDIPTIKQIIKTNREQNPEILCYGHRWFTQKGNLFDEETYIKLAPFDYKNGIVLGIPTPINDPDLRLDEKITKKYGLIFDKSNKIYIYCPDKSKRTH